MSRPISKEFPHSYQTTMLILDSGNKLLYNSENAIRLEKPTHHRSAAKQGVFTLAYISKQFQIAGMTCANCPQKIKKALIGLPGVKTASVSYETGSARIEFDPGRTSFDRIKTVIGELGYQVLPEGRGGSRRIFSMIAILGGIVVLYVLLERLGILNLLVPSQLADSSMGYGMLFVVGLLTSVHCITMCGGINLSQCLPTGEQTNGRSALLPSLKYNLGRVVSYTGVGFLLGFVGMLLGSGTETGIPALLQGALKMLAGAVMVIMGINMLGLFPWLRKLNLKMPDFISKRIGTKKSTARRPFVIGLLNGLMPCGPLQSMQILALASGNPFVGALSMLLFSLGTVPLMLGLGTLVTALGKRFARGVMNVGAVLVTVLGLAMLSQGGSLSGMLLPDTLLLAVIGLCVIGVAASIPFSKKGYRIVSVVTAAAIVITAGAVWKHYERKEQSLGSGVQITDGVQLVYSTLQPGKYPAITVQAGTPVRWIIDAPAGSINGCNYKMIIQEYGIEYAFQEGENIIEFTPTDTGTVSYTCWMGMIRGSIVVTEGSGESQTGDTDDSATENETDFGDAQVIAPGGELVISTSQISGTAAFYPIIVDGTQMEVFAIRASDGTVRTAFNTCQMCYTSGRGYYVQEGKYLICQNCGSHFTADQVERQTGGCNPWQISAENKTQTEDTIRIGYDFLKESSSVFTNWKQIS